MAVDLGATLVVVVFGFGFIVVVVVVGCACTEVVVRLAPAPLLLPTALLVLAAGVDFDDDFAVGCGTAGVVLEDGDFTVECVATGGVVVLEDDGFTGTTTTFPLQTGVPLEQSQVDALRGPA